MTKHLTKTEFQEKIFDFEKGADWKFAGERPCIVDFYAAWCGPCKRVAPILEELSAEYDGKIDIYKVDTEAEPELASAFGIQSIPTMLFVPMNGKPQVAVGALPKEAIVNAIGTVLLAAQTPH